MSSYSDTLRKSTRQASVDSRPLHKRPTGIHLFHNLNIFSVSRGDCIVRQIYFHGPLKQTTGVVENLHHSDALKQPFTDARKKAKETLKDIAFLDNKVVGVSAFYIESEIDLPLYFRTTMIHCVLFMLSRGSPAMTQKFNFLKIFVLFL